MNQLTPFTNRAPATGVTAYLKNGGALEKAARMANHAADVTLDEVEAILV
jgi:hypothetical protein